MDESDDLEVDIDLELEDIVINLQKFYILNIMPFDTNAPNDLPLVHPELIDWGQEDPPELQTFSDDHAIINFLNPTGLLYAGVSDIDSTEKLNTTTTYGDNTRPFSHKNAKKNNGSDGENRNATVSDLD